MNMKGVYHLFIVSKKCCIQFHIDQSCWQVKTVNGFHVVDEVFGEVTQKNSLLSQYFPCKIWSFLDSHVFLEKEEWYKENKENDAEKL